MNLDEEILTGLREALAELYRRQVKVLKAAPSPRDEGRCEGIQDGIELIEEVIAKASKGSTHLTPGRRLRVFCEERRLYKVARSPIDPNEFSLTFYPRDAQ